MCNADLELFQCDYQMKSELVKRQNDEGLDAVYSNYRYELNEGDSEKARERIRNNTEDKITFGKFKQLKAGKREPFSRKTNSLKDMKHMKSVLGHISVMDQNVINPVPIYCLAYSNTDDLIFTGDNNG
jgi:hypothetical protein